MTAILALVRRDDFISDVSLTSLLSYTAGIEIAANGWAQKSMQAHDISTSETITFRVKGTSQDDVAAKVQALDQLMRQAQEYIDSPIDLYGLWLRDKKNTETNYRQAILFSIAGQTRDTLIGPAFNSNSFISEYVLTMERGHWEGSQVNYAMLAMSTLGGLSLAGTVVGDYSARLAITSFNGVNGGGGPLSKFWLGLRSTRYGTPANFIPKWECELGTAGTDTATDTSSDSTASGSTPKTLRCTFATAAAMTSRCMLTVSQVAAAHPDDQRGAFLVLLRAKLTAGSTVINVRLSTGFSGASTFSALERVTISGTEWVLYELGLALIPESGRLISGTSYVSLQALRIEAERISGTASLDLDCLILIPYDEGFVYANGGQVVYAGGDERPVYVNRSADGATTAIGFTGGTPNFNDIECNVIGGMPVGVTYGVLAASRAGSAVLADTLSVTCKAYHRHSTLRGAA